MAQKGSLVVGQSGGPTAVINRTLVSIVESALTAEHAVDQILGLRHGVQGLLASDFVDLRRQTPSFLPDLRETPSSVLGSCRYKLQGDDLEPALTALKRVE